MYRMNSAAANDAAHQQKMAADAVAALGLSQYIMNQPGARWATFPANAGFLPTTTAAAYPPMYTQPAGNAGVHAAAGAPQFWGASQTPPGGQ